MGCRRAALRLPLKGAPSAERWAPMRVSFEQAVAALQRSFPESGLHCQILMHWMRMEAYAVADASQTQLVGKQLMRLWGSCYNAWSAFIAAVRHCLAGSETGADAIR